MNTKLIQLSIFSLFIFFTSCTNDDDAVTTTPVSLETKTVTNLYAPQTGGQGQPTAGAFTKFSFSEN